MKKHVNIPIFIPHLGCPNQCVFCNQRYISSVTEFDISKVRSEIEASLATVDFGKTEAEIAFFGGSFTGIDRALMVALLDIAEEYVSQGRVSHIRLSTRPDYIDVERLDILSRYHVKTVELGVQSASDEVLARSKRGHTVKDTLNAFRLVRDHGFELVGQMMIGLPGATIEDELATAQLIIDSGACSARIYPTIVFKNTKLDEMYHANEYLPLSLEEAVERSTAVYRRFLDNGVSVIRIGLCASENLSSDATYSAGPNHMAIGELVESAVYYDCICDEIDSTYSADELAGGVLCVTVNSHEVSKASGHGRKNKLCIKDKYELKNVKIVGNDDLPRYKVEISLI